MIKGKHRREMGQDRLPQDIHSHTKTCQKTGPHQAMKMKWNTVFQAEGRAYTKGEARRSMIYLKK